MLRAIPLLCALALAFAASAAKAQPSDEGRALGFAEALAGVVEHPDVRGPLAAAGVLERSRRVGPNGFASVALEAGYVTDSSGERTFTGQITPLYSFILMRQAKAARGTIGARARALSAEAQAALVAHQLEVAHAWLSLYSAERLEARLAEEERLLAEWRALVERARQRGVATTTDLLRLSAEAANIAQRRRQQQSALIEARRKLAQSLLLAHGEAHLRTDGEPPPVTPCDDFDVRAVAGRLPATALARRRREDAEAFVRFDVSTFWPGQLSVGAQVPLDARGVAGVVELDLPMISAQRAARARDTAEVASADIAEAAALREAEQLLVTAASAVHTSDAALRLMREQTIPSYEALLDVVHRRLVAGEATIFEELASRRRVIEARVQEETLAASERWARIRLELLLEAGGGCAMSEEDAR